LTSCRKLMKRDVDVAKAELLETEKIDPESRAMRREERDAVVGRAGRIGTERRGLGVLEMRRERKRSPGAEESHARIDLGDLERRARRRLREMKREKKDVAALEMGMRAREARRVARDEDAPEKVRRVRLVARGVDVLEMGRKAREARQVVRDEDAPEKVRRVRLVARGEDALEMREKKVRTSRAEEENLARIDHLKTESLEKTDLDAEENHARTDLPATKETKSAGRVEVTDPDDREMTTKTENDEGGDLEAAVTTNRDGVLFFQLWKNLLQRRRRKKRSQRLWKKKKKHLPQRKKVQQPVWICSEEAVMTMAHQRCPA